MSLYGDDVIAIKVPNRENPHPGWNLTPPPHTWVGIGIGHVTSSTPPPPPARAGVQGTMPKWGYHGCSSRSQKAQMCHRHFTSCFGQTLVFGQYHCHGCTVILAIQLPPLGLKARLDNLIYTWQRFIWCRICIPWGSALLLHQSISTGPGESTSCFLLRKIVFVNACIS